MSTTQSSAGTPSPNRWIQHERIDTDAKSIPNIGILKEGAVCANGVPLCAMFTIAGASRARVRFKADVGGELKLQYCRPRVRPWDAIPYTFGQPTPVTIVANTENAISTTDINGESMALVTFTPTGAGLVTFCDLMAL